MLVRVLGIVIALSCVAVMVLGWSAYRVNSGTRTFRDRAMRLNALKDIVRMDAGLTMSVRLAAATGEKRWRQDYHAYKEQLAVMLNELKSLAETEEAQRAVRKIDAANEAILKIEGESLAMGHREEAFWLVTSSEYDQREKEYHDGVHILMESLESDVRAQSERGQSASRLLLGGAAVALAAAVIALLSLVINLRRHLVERESTVAALHALIEERAVLREKATTDALTGVWNRATILEILESELKRAKVSGGRLAVIMADLDHFKKVNDTHGHPAGDVVLRECAARMKSAVRPADAVGRYGGEEFLVVLPGATAEAAAKTAERVRRAVAASSTSNGIAMTVSLGVASGVDSGEQIVKSADVALYRAKQEGRNRIVTA